MGLGESDSIPIKLYKTYKPTGEYKSNTTNVSDRQVAALLVSDVGSKQQRKVDSPVFRSFYIGRTQVILEDGCLSDLIHSGLVTCDTSFPRQNQTMRLTDLGKAELEKIRARAEPIIEQHLLDFANQGK
jgi:hypothetical protein